MRFGVLGPLAVRTGDGEPVAVPEAKVRALLAALLVDPGAVVSADRLVEDLWGNDPPADPAGAVQTLVSRLRRALTRAGAPGRDLVVHRPPGYLLRVAEDAVDTGRFAALTARARTADGPRERAALLTSALALWRGPAFADFADEPFTRAAITRLAEQRLLAVEEQAEARLELGEHGALAGELGELTERHPLRERLRAAHLRALYGAGRPSEALDRYQDLRRRLDEELGLTPGPELVALHQEILRQDPALRAEPAPAEPRPRTNLPTPVTDLIGRSRAITEVGSLVAANALVTLIGPGGVGKTRLAVEIATGLADSFPDGTWLVDLAAHPCTAGSASAAATDALAEVVAATLGIRDDIAPGPPSAGTARTPLGRLTDVLRGKRLLLVLDNCEHVVESAARLAEELLGFAPGVRILATAQEPLDIAGEHLWSVPPLDLPAADATTAERARSGAVRLFVARAAAVSPGFALTEDNAEAVAAVCRRLDGIPLALELAAGRVRVLGVGELAERLDDRLRLLTGGRRGAPARHRTLRAMIDWSWELLTAAERIVLRRLAIHADGCTLDAAETVCAGDGVTSGQVLDLLARLVDRSLVLVTHQADGPRYRLPESVAVYCLERLRADDHDRVRRAHAHYYTALAERTDARLRGGDQQRALRRLDAETANFRAVLDAAPAVGDASLIRRVTLALVWYWFLRGRLTEAGRYLSAALAATEADPAPAPASVSASGAVDEHTRVAAWRAGMSLLAGDRADPDRTGRSAGELYADIDDPRGRAMAGWFLGHAVTSFGEPAVGEDLTDRVLADFRALDDRWGVAATLVDRSTQSYVCGDLASARRDAEESLALFRDVGDRWGRSQAMRALGRLAEVAGDYARASEWHRDGLRVAESLELWTVASTRWSELGRIALLTGDHARAEEYLERGRRLAVEQGDRTAQEFAEVGLALVARRRGRPDVAEPYLRTWLEWNRRFDAANGAALILAELGFAAEQRGDVDAALALHGEGLTAARDTGDPRAVALALEGLAGARALAGSQARAAHLLGAAAQARTSVGAPLPAAERGDVDRITAAVRAALGEREFADAFDAGAAAQREDGSAARCG